jgi:hypothetical protein
MNDELHKYGRKNTQNLTTVFVLSYRVGCYCLIALL